MMSFDKIVIVTVKGGYSDWKDFCKGVLSLQQYVRSNNSNHRLAQKPLSTPQKKGRHVANGK